MLSCQAKSRLCGNSAAHFGSSPICKLCLCFLQRSPQILAVMTQATAVAPVISATMVKHHPIPTALMSGCNAATLPAANVQRTMFMEACAVDGREG